MCPGLLSFLNLILNCVGKVRLVYRNTSMQQNLLQNRDVLVLAACSTGERFIDYTYSSVIPY